ncbi:MAG TPA: hypothetical protein VKU38_03750 [Ktedonobacteraceae bacterium]|nr:hypothetical protein [Ktedonobacteraceae bacterium]
MDRNDYSHTRITNMQIDELIQKLQQGQSDCQSMANEPELRMVHDIRRAYQAETCEDAHSLEHVLTKLKGDQAEAQTKILFLPHVYQQQERISTMQNTIETITRSKSSKRWQQRARLLAAVLFLTLLVGGLLTALNVGHITTPTTQSTSSTIASSVITSVALSDNVNLSNQDPTMQQFTVGQTIWLTSMINVGKVKEPGSLMVVKWYENNRLYATTKHGVPQEESISTALTVVSLHSHQVFTQPGNGKVEVYLNGQLVTTLHFVIK